MSPVTTMAEQWQSFKDKCFPQGMPPAFEKEIRQAFFCGAYATLLIGEQIASQGETLAKATDRQVAVHMEISATCADFAFVALRRQ